MKTITLLLSALVASSAFAASAFFTGKMEYVTTVTGKSAVRCEYNYLGKKYYQLFPASSSCPSFIEIE